MSDPKGAAHFLNNYEGKYPRTEGVRAVLSIAVRLFRRFVFDCNNERTSLGIGAFSLSKVFSYLHPTCTHIDRLLLGEEHRQMRRVLAPAFSSVAEIWQYTILLTFQFIVAL